MNKKFIAILLIALFTLSFLVTGCSNSSDEEVIKVGVDDTYPPMEFVDEEGNTVGFDIDLANAIGEKLGKKIEFVSVAWEGIFLGLESDKYDCIISSVSMTSDRMESMDFAGPYLANGQVIVVEKGDTSITKPEDLEGKKAGVQVETTADIAAQKYQENISFELEQYDEIIQAFSDLKIGRIDAIVVDAVVAMEYVSKNIEDYEITSAQLSNEPIAIAFKKGNELRDEFEEALEELRNEGKLKDISIKWFNEDYTTNIDKDLW